ncbi:RluA family pseudouridine synthase [Anaplasmataceae bacterium AB001_6]|nr:RluA family pseudouridine synthase [Anaplasmataceae bacterium AB001_6]
MNEIIKIEVTCEQDNNTRLDQFLSDKIDKVSRTQVKSAILDGKVSDNSGYNEFKPNHKVKIGDIYSLEYREQKFFSKLSDNFPIKILYEDEYLIIIDKPANLVVHAGTGTNQNTLSDLIKSKINIESFMQENCCRSGIVHRLDKDTTGTLLIAKNSTIHSKLSIMFAEKKIKRKYIAITQGIPKNIEDTIKTKIALSKREKGKMSISYNRGKLAITHYCLIGQINDCAVLDVELETGKTHQIRLHMQYNSTPIIGDRTYNNSDKYHHLIKRQALHSYKIGFMHPVLQQKITVHSNLPSDVQFLVKNLTL